MITDLKLYHRHVEQVYQLETFYGDETLHALLEHSKAVSERVEDFTTLFSRLEEEELTDALEEQIDDNQNQKLEEKSYT